MSKVAPLASVAFAASGVPTLGIISNGIDYFLLFFYSQIVGLSPALAGMALGIALVFDAVSDPLVGYLSDNWRSRLGRRHPFMYASILPLTALYILIWYPPGTGSSQWSVFGFLLGVAILLRLAMTMFDVPVRTFVAELTTDYDERTRLASLRVTVSWVTGSLMSIAMYAFWLSDSTEYAHGELNMAGYQQAGIVGGAVILVSLLVASVGLHPQIPRLHHKTAVQVGGVMDMFRSLGQLFRIRSMRALLGADLFLAAGLGTTAALWIYQYSAFYGMNSDQMSLLIVVQLIATFAVVPIVRKCSAKRDKKVMAMRFLVTSVAISLVLPPLVILGIAPSRGSDGLMYLLIVYDFVSQIVWIVAASFVYSLYADVTEELLVRFGKRMEGTIFAGQTFVSKSATAFGAILAGTMLSAIHYSMAGDGAEASEQTLARLGVCYMASWVVLASIGIWFMSKYEITRSSHAAEVEALEAISR